MQDRSGAGELSAAGYMFPDSLVQAVVLFPHYEAILRWEIVDLHGEFHYGAVQRQELVQHLLGVTAAERLVPRSAFVLSLHSERSHDYLCDSALASGSEIETIDRG